MAAAALQAAPQVVAVARDTGSALAHSAGLTEEEEYEGWLALAVIAYAVVWPPVKTAWHIEQQLAGVMDQLYKWLGGAGSALEGGISSLQKAAGTVVSTLERWI